MNSLKNSSTSICMNDGLEFKKHSKMLAQNNTAQHKLKVVSRASVLLCINQHSRETAVLSNRGLNRVLSVSIPNPALYLKEKAAALLLGALAVSVQPASAESATFPKSIALVSSNPRTPATVQIDSLQSPYPRNINREFFHKLATGTDDDWQNKVSRQEYDQAPEWYRSVQKTFGPVQLKENVISPRHKRSTETSEQTHTEQHHQISKVFRVGNIGSISDTEFSNPQEVPFNSPEPTNIQSTSDSHQLRFRIHVFEGETLSLPCPSSASNVGNYWKDWGYNRGFDVTKAPDVVAKIEGENLVGRWVDEHRAVYKKINNTQYYFNTNIGINDATEYVLRTANIQGVLEHVCSGIVSVSNHLPESITVKEGSEAILPINVKPLFNTDVAIVKDQTLVWSDKCKKLYRLPGQVEVTGNTEVEGYSLKFNPVSLSHQGNYTVYFNLRDRLLNLEDFTVSQTTTLFVEPTTAGLPTTPHQAVTAGSVEPTTAGLPTTPHQAVTAGSEDVSDTKRTNGSGKILGIYCAGVATGGLIVYTALRYVQGYKSGARGKELAMCPLHPVRG